MFFGEPRERRAFAEYFGDYFRVQRVPNGHYRAARDGREDESQYAGGQLDSSIKKSLLKNFVIQRLL